MGSFEALDPEDQLGYQAVRLADQLSKTWFRTLKKHGVNPRQFHTLAALARAPELSQAELARRVMVTPQSMGESLTALLVAGLISRERSENGKPAAVTITRAGKTLLARAYPVVESAERENFTALTADERRELARLFKKLLG